MTLPDTDDLAALGGVMVNYAPVEDPTTDLDAAYDNKVRANVAGMTQTAIRAECHFTTHATTPTMDSHYSVWGNAPAVAPTVARQALGQFRITWPSSATDELGTSHTINLRGGKANPQSATFVQPQVKKVSANVMDIYLFDAAGAASDFAGTVIDVYVS